MLMLNDDSNYYDLLEIKPDATAPEIRTAYLRAKTTYKKDGAALYTLIDENETTELLNRIEEAYLVLSNSDKRREYDRSHGLLVIDERELAVSKPPRNHKIVSIDRVPPMEAMSSSEDLLIPPVTAIPAHSVTSAQTSAPAATAPRDQREMTREILVPKHSDELTQLVAAETEWKGDFLKKVRELRKVSIEELSEVTRINKAYLIEIEEENYEKLPAPVFLRGFITQVAKQLRLPPEKITTSYLARVQEARASKDKRKPLW